MLQVWGREESGNVKKVLWCADELLLEFERFDIGGKFGGLDTPEYRAMNPNGLIPTINDNGYILWEANTIVRYLCAKHSFGEMYPADLRERASAERWMDWQMAHLAPAFFKLFIGLVRTPASERDQVMLENARKETERHFLIVDDFLNGRKYIGDDRFTMGDIPIGCTVYRWFAMPIQRPHLPHLRAWYERLTERPAYRKRVMTPLV